MPKSPSPALSIRELMEPSNIALEGKSTWWLCLAKEELKPRLDITTNHPTLHVRLQDRYQLVCDILDERLHRGQTELPELKLNPKGDYHADVRIGRVR